MKLNLSQAWLERIVADEVGHEIGAGALAYKPVDQNGVANDPRSEQEQVAFSTLIQFMRRKRRLSIEELAKVAQVDVVEILGIETDPHFEPKPRSIHQLANYFGLPVIPLTRLSGLADGRREKYTEAAIHFAAKSKGVQTLTRDEEAALSEFVKFLSSAEPD
jgi:transcriptional regulator with XRE-family HTH domain